MLNTLDGAMSLKLWGVMHEQVIFGPITGNLVFDHFQFVIFYHPPLWCPFVLKLLFGGHI
jgi:hypothetical protein